jgi:Cu-processing system ATP-binding protein
MVRFQSIYKSFGKRKLFEDLNLYIEGGRTTAVLGPNGSGKTTLVKILLGLVIPDRGKLFIDGMDVQKDITYKRLIGYMPQVPQFPENLTVREILTMLEDIRSQKAVRAEELIELLNLKGEMNKRFSSLSGGTKQKVGALSALAFDVPLIVLDEPMVGLDPLSAYRLKEFLLRERSKKTILYISHIMSEVEEIAEDVVFLTEGKLLFQGEIEELKVKTGKKNLEEAVLCLLS